MDEPFFEGVFEMGIYYALALLGKPAVAHKCLVVREY